MNGMNDFVDFFNVQIYFLMLILYYKYTVPIFHFFTYVVPRRIDVLNDQSVILSEEWSIAEAMVSFSCDECQDVVTKPKVQRHLLKCRGATLSCLDCLKTFDKQTVIGHTSCISEAEKYGPKTQQKPMQSSQTFCAVCDLHLNGAVHAHQHYESKKHRAALRRSSKVASLPGKDAEKDPSSQCEKNGLSSGCQDLPGSSNNTRKQNEKGNQMKATKNRRVSLKRILKQLVKNTPNKRMKKSKLVKAVRLQLGQDAPSDLVSAIDKKIGKIRKLSVIDNRVVWVHPNSHLQS